MAKRIAGSGNEIADKYVDQNINFKVDVYLRNLLSFFLVLTVLDDLTIPYTVCHSGRSCMNGGTCDFGAESREIYCKCPTGFIGPFCSDTVTCAHDSACANQTCTEYEGQRYCSCNADKTGFFCEMSVTPGETCRSSSYIENNQSNKQVIDRPINHQLIKGLITFLISLLEIC